MHHYDLGYTRRATPQLLRPALDHLGRAVALAATSERRHRDAVQRAQVSAQLLLHLGRWQESRRRGRKGEIVVEDAGAAADELLAFARRHADSGALHAPGIVARVARERSQLA